MSHCKPFAFHKFILYFFFSFFFTDTVGKTLNLLCTFPHQDTHNRDGLIKAFTRHTPCFFLMYAYVFCSTAAWVVCSLHNVVSAV